MYDLKLCFIISGATQTGSQGLLLALYSEISPGGLGRPFRMPGIKSQLAVCKMTIQYANEECKFEYDHMTYDLYVILSLQSSIFVNSTPFF